MSITRLPSTFAKYSDGVATSGTGEWVHVAGQIGLGDDGKVVPGGLAAETGVAFDRIERVLHHFGATLSDVIKVTVFVTDLSQYAEFARVRAQRFGDDSPASSAVEVKGLMLGAQVEVEAVAFVST
ncbi:MAG TPA: RidA family protein [Solirubrobacteraceae bacterium]|nr:RidA family protein [Solirubrobacteraceae bacterium]